MAGSPEQSRGTYANETAGLEIDLDSRTVTRHGQLVSLAPLEYSLLYQLTNNEGRVMTHQALLTKVWGQEYLHEVDYLKVYVRRPPRQRPSSLSGGLLFAVHRWLNQHAAGSLHPRDSDRQISAGGLPGPDNGGQHRRWLR